jgi:arylsulfatase A-like enzyme
MAQPNLLFVFPDQMRGQAMGFLGEEPVRTPNLDRFAAEALVLDYASATYPVCSPYRAMLMTGKYPHANKVVSNCTSRTAPYGVELQAADRCWSDILKEQGYALGYIGKWHLDSPLEPYIDCRNNEGDPKWNEWCPPGRRHGFDFWYAYGTYDDHNRPMYWHGDAARIEVVCWRKGFPRTRRAA